MSNYLKASLAALALLATSVLGTYVAAGDASATEEPEICVIETLWTATTAVSNRPDSGTQGNDWATDDFVRRTTLDRNADCSYTITLKDGGQFTTIAGVKSPGGTATLTQSFKGQFHGGAKIKVTTEVQPTKPDATSDGTISSSQWSTLVFPGTQPIGPYEWGWTYETRCEKWMNAPVNTGDITKKCTVPTGGPHPHPPSSSSSTPTTTTTVPKTTTSTSAPVTTTTPPSSTTTTSLTIGYNSSVYYADCAAARAAGAAPMNWNQSGYRRALDRDNDSVACEPDERNVAKVSDDDLASTGAAVIPLTVVGLLLVAAGAVAVLVRRRRTGNAVDGTDVP